MNQLETLREKIVPVLVPHGARRIALFGSVVRGEETPNSDIDVLVAFHKPIGLFALVRLERELSERLARPVDLVTIGFLSKYIRPTVEREQVVLYEE